MGQTLRHTELHKILGRDKKRFGKKTQEVEMLRNWEATGKKAEGNRRRKQRPRMKEQVRIACR